MRKLSIALLSAALLAGATTAQADDKKFDGVQAGVDFGYIDFENAGGDLALDLFLGYRVQTESNFVFGVEGTFGGIDNDLIDNIWSINGTLGYVVGEEQNGLIFVNSGFAKVNFDGFGSTELFKADLGYEHAVGENMRLRIKVTTFEFDDFRGTVGISYNF